MKSFSYLPPGTKVIDGLTGKDAVIVGVTFQDGTHPDRPNVSAAQTVGYWLDNEYLSGGRHPWEVTEKEGGE